MSGDYEVLFSIYEVGVVSKFLEFVNVNLVIGVCRIINDILRWVSLIVFMKVVVFDIVVDCRVVVFVFYLLGEGLIVVIIDVRY